MTAAVGVGRVGHPLRGRPAVPGRGPVREVIDERYVAPRGHGADQVGVRREVVAEVLFMLVMVEVVRLLIVYLQEHRVAVDFMVELGIVASLREIVLRGVTELGWVEVLALTVFLLALGALLRFGDLRTPGVPSTGGSES